jgi:(2Fe-2S) ferredoxin
MTDEITTPTTGTEARNVSVAARPGGGYSVKVCAGTACLFAGSMAVYDAFVQEVQTAGLGDSVEVSIIGCHGLCSMSPVVVLSDDTLYGHLKPKDVSRVVEEHLKGGQPVERFLYKDEQTGERIRNWKDIGFYRLQTRIALRDVGVINPETIDAYVAVGGYEAARMALTEKTPEWIIEHVTDSGIRGRGGAGFPTGVKWKFANQSKSDEKYLICNADEGDPGAFMDCSILEGDPHAVIEGMIIGSYAIGAH